MNNSVSPQRPTRPPRSTSTDSWHIEYGRVAVFATLPFATIDTLLVSLELESVRRSAAEFAKLLRRRLRR